MGGYDVGYGGPGRGLIAGVDVERKEDVKRDGGEGEKEGCRSEDDVEVVHFSWFERSEERRKVDGPLWDEGLLMPGCRITSMLGCRPPSYTFEFEKCSGGFIISWKSEGANGRVAHNGMVRLCDREEGC